MESGPQSEDGQHPRRALVVSALGFAQILAWGSSFYLPAVLAKPVAAETGWPLTWVVGGLSLGLLVAGLISPYVGRAIEHRGGRPVLILSTVLFAVGLSAMALASSAWVYLGSWMILGLGMGTGLYDAAFSVLGRLYGRTARSAITTLTLWGGFASTVCWPLSAYLVQTLGWRDTCLSYAGLHLFVILPMYLFVLPREEKRRRSTDAGEASSETPAPPGLSQKGRRLLIGLLALILTTGSAISSMWAVHLLTILQSRGISLEGAVALGTLVGPSQVGARLIEMFIARYYHPIWTMMLSVILIALGLGLLWAKFPILAIPLICFGAGNGIWSIARGVLPLALFGPDGYAALMGRLAMPSLLAQAVAPSFGAWLIGQVDVRGMLALLVVLALCNAATVLVLLLFVRRVSTPV